MPLTERTRKHLQQALQDPNIQIERVRGDEELLSVTSRFGCMTVGVPDVYDPGDEWVENRKRLKAEKVK